MKFIKLSTLLSAMFVVMFFYKNVSGQTQNVDVSIPIPPSPTAASLGVYGEIPVSNYTGIPSISIPLYEIDAKGFKFPISLNYHAGGIRVEDEASWIGLGWSLSAGGLITRSIKGLDDLPTEGPVIGYPDIVLPEPDNEDVYATSGNSTHFNVVKEIRNKNYDGEPDIFYFNFMGHSGKFILKKRSSPSLPLEVQILSQEKMSIQVSRNLQTNAYEWIITTVDGNRFIFKTIEKTKTYSQTLTGVDWNSDPVDEPTIVTSSWYLSAIITNKEEMITFEYTDPLPNGARRTMLKSDMWVQYLYREFIFYSGYCPLTSYDCLPNTHYYTNTLNINYEVYLKEIRYRNVAVQFTTSDRVDVSPFNDPYVQNKIPQKLDRITINSLANNQLEVLKYFDLTSDYFNSGTNRGAVSKRLKLLSLTEKNISESKKPYFFFYNTIHNSNIEIVDKDSRSKDHWGFYNGKDNSNVLLNNVSKATSIPLIKIYNSSNGQTTYANGANRETDPQYLATGSLSKIVYPTGGHNEFLYEPNDYGNGIEGQFVKNQRNQALVKNGPAVQNPDGPDFDTYTITLVKKTLVSFFISSSTTSSNCNVTTTDRICGSIINTATNVPIHLNLNTGCNKSDRTKYMVELEAGTYSFHVYATDAFLTFGTIEWEEETTTPLLSKLGGGLRIKEIKTVDAITSKEKIRKYSYRLGEEPGSKSSGILMSPLVYDYVWHSLTRKDCYYFSLNNPVEEEYLCFYNYSESSSSLPLATSASGSSVGYSMVTIEDVGSDGLQNGKSIYEFMNMADGHLFRPYMPTVPALSNGLPIKETHFAKTPSGFKKLSEKESIYEREDNATVRMRGMKVFVPTGVDPRINTYHRFVNFYSLYSEWWHLKKEVSTIFSDVSPTLNISTVTDYFYDNPEHMQLTKMISNNSNGLKMTTKYLRPADYQSAINPVIDEMRGVAHLHDRVIEEIVEVERNGQVKVKTASYTKYDFGDLFIVPKSTYVLANDYPKPDFVSSLANGLPSDPDYKVRQNVVYDPWSGNLVEVCEDGKKYTTLIWGYGHLYPIAKIENAKRVDVEVVISNMDLATFGDLTTPSDSEIAVFLAPLRTNVLLKDALITTYTYKPLIGMTSMTDPKGLTSRFEYDGFGRLRAEKDHEGRVLKAYDYHYKQ